MLILIFHKLKNRLNERSQMMHRINIDESRVSQRLAKQSKDLGDITAILARQTSEDSASMITIAAVTMFFLPATFISVRS